MNPQIWESSAESRSRNSRSGWDHPGRRRGGKSNGLRMGRRQHFRFKMQAKDEEPELG